MYVGKCGLKTSTPSPGSRKASAKYCSNGFAPEATTTSPAPTEAELLLHELRRRRAESGSPRLGRTRSGSPRSRGCPRLRVRRAGERAVADLQLDDVLPSAFRARARASTVNALSGLRSRARA